MHLVPSHITFPLSRGCKCSSHDVFWAVIVLVWVTSEGEGSDFRKRSIKIKGKVVPVFNELSTPWRRMREWLYRSTFSWPRHYLEVVSFTPRPLYPRGKSPRYPLDRRLGGSQNQSGRRGEETILDPTMSSLSHPASSQMVTGRSFCGGEEARAQSWPLTSV
jgi:hypothetical protein